MPESDIEMVHLGASETRNRQWELGKQISLPTAITLYYTKLNIIMWTVTSYLYHLHDPPTHSLPPHTLLSPHTPHSPHTTILTGLFDCPQQYCSG